MIEKPFMLIISGPSGVGKDSIMSGLLSDESLDFEKVVTTTTRDIRSNEINGSKYYHIGRDDFEKGITDGRFLEYESVHDNYYGGTFEEFDRILDKGKHIIYELDVAGAIRIKKKLGDKYEIKTIFIAPPFIDTLIDRLRSRGTESQESIDRRIQTARNEMRYIDFYDHVIVNDDLTRAIAEMIDLVKIHE